MPTIPTVYMLTITHARTDAHHPTCFHLRARQARKHTRAHLLRTPAAYALTNTYTRAHSTVYVLNWAETYGLLGDRKMKEAELAGKDYMLDRTELRDIKPFVTVSCVSPCAHILGSLGPVIGVERRHRFWTRATQLFDTCEAQYIQT